MMFKLGKPDYSEFFPFCTHSVTNYLSLDSGTTPQPYFPIADFNFLLLLQDKTTISVLGCTSLNQETVFFYISAQGPLKNANRAPYFSH